MERTTYRARQPASVAVLIAARNARTTIARAVTSALSEPEVTRVVVVDDASVDTTSAVARAADDGSGRLDVLSLSENVGPAAARNRALDVCRSDWVSVLDADDFFLPGRTERLLALARESEADFVADDLLQVSEADQDALAAGSSLFEPESRNDERLDFESFILGNISRRGRLRKELGFLKPLMRHAFLKEHGLRYDERLRLGEDYELYARALALGAVFVLSRTRGYVSVARRGSLSDHHTLEDLERLYECDLRLAELSMLEPRERRALALHAQSLECKLEWRRLLAGLHDKNLVAALRPFTRSLPVTSYLVTQLADELWKRAQRLRRSNEGLLPTPAASSAGH